MGVCTKGFVLLPDDRKDVLRIAGLIEGAINSLVVARRDAQFSGRERFSRACREQFSECDLNLHPSSGMLSAAFTLSGEERSLRAFFTCDSDHRDFGPHSVSVHLGAHGESELVIARVLNALSMLGVTYIDLNDSDDIPYVPTGRPAPSVLQALALHYVKASDVRDWVNAFDAGDVGAGIPFEMFFGASETRIRELVNSPDRSTAWEALRQMANVSVEPSPAAVGAPTEAALESATVTATAAANQGAASARRARP